MRITSRALIGAILWSSLAFGTGKPAEPTPTAYRTVQVGHYWKVDRASLPSHGPSRAAALRTAMEDEIRGRGGFAQQRADTPAFELIADAPLRQTQEADFGSVPARYEVSQAALVGGKLKAKLLLPVSGHVGLQAATQYSVTNRNRVTVRRADGMTTALPEKVSTGFVTEHDVELALKPGRNLIEFSPDPQSGGVGGYRAGRLIEIDVK